MDLRSEANLEHVHPDLCRVIRNAAQIPQPFIVIYGIRTLAAEAEAVRTGHSHTMRSRHLPDEHYATEADPDGVACAVDVVALIDGKIDFAEGREEEEVFGQIAKQVQESAFALNIPIQWGGSPVGAWVPGKVSTFRDFGHFQLPWLAYP